MNKLIIFLLLTYIGSAFTMTSLKTKVLKNNLKINCKIPNIHLKSPKQDIRKLLDAYKALSKNKLIRNYSTKSNLSHNKKIITKYKNLALKRKFLKYALRKYNGKINEQKQDINQKKEQALYLKEKANHTDRIAIASSIGLIIFWTACVILGDGGTHNI